LIGQSQFDLTLSNETYSTNQDTFCLQLDVSFDALGKLGSANLVMDYDPNSLGNAFIDDWPGLDPSLYLGANLTTFETGKSALNLELDSLNQGLVVPDGGTAVLYLSKVCFEVLNASGDHSVDWYQDASRGTVAYLDDEATLLSPGVFTGYQAPGAFPVEWLGFEVSQEEGQVRLDWSTAQEVNNEGFFVKRSLDGVFFEELGFVPSQGNNQGSHSYDWYDVKADDLRDGQRLYYLLTQVDLDGTTTNSEIRSIRLNLRGLSYVRVFPQPVSAPGEVNIDLAVRGVSNIEMTLLNALGQTLDTRHQELPASGRQSLRFPLGNLSPGLYYLRFSDYQEVYHFVQILIQ
jgi:hypothetical protein